MILIRLRCSFSVCTLSSALLLSSCHFSTSSTNTHCTPNYEHTSCLTCFFPPENKYFLKVLNVYELNICYYLLFVPCRTPCSDWFHPLTTKVVKVETPNKIWLYTFNAKHCSYMLSVFHYFC